jgi:5-methylcytosine-specific restriction endonuclease McrA
MTETPIKRKGNAPSVPCSSCGRLLWWHTSYNPQTTRCQDCRRAARGLALTTAECPVCGKTFAPRHGARSCSRSCGGVLAKGGVAKRIHQQCQVCGIEYRASYTGQRTCGRACGSILRFGPPKALTPVQQTLSVLSCRGCDSAFLAARDDLKWCDPCRARGFYRYKPVADEHRICPECGMGFTATFTGGCRRRYCCDDCTKTAARRARDLARGRFRVSKATRAGIYLRDRWTCHLCLRPIPADAATVHGHPQSASLDHLVPRAQLAKGDPRIRDPRNLATAHLWCNVMRGDAPYSSEPLQWTDTGTLTVTSRWVFDWAVDGPPTSWRTPQG